MVRVNSCADGVGEDMVETVALRVVVSGGVTVLSFLMDEGGVVVGASDRFISEG